MIRGFRKFYIIIATVAISIICFSGRAHAATFNPGDIISDSIFNNATSMSASQINSFLNSFSSSCISPNNGFSAPDPTGYSPSGGFTYGGNVSAGQVIYDAAQAYNINPQVLLVTIEKEQSLVTGGTGCSVLQYAAAAGYGCPDGGSEYSYTGVDLYTINGVTATSVSDTCVNTAQKVGFSQQLIRAAWLLKFGEERSEGNVGWNVQLTNYPESGDVWNNSDDPQSCYGGPMTQGTWEICPNTQPTYYDGYTTIDGSSVQMMDGATATLYYYTPHFSGNEHFFNIFTSWFGDSSQDQYLWEIAEASGGNGQYYLIVGNTKRWIPSTYEYDSWGLNNYPLQQVSGAYLNGIPTIPNLGNLGLLANGQYVYVDSGQKYNLSSSALADWGFNSSAKASAAPVNTILSALPTVGNATQYIESNGTGDYFLMSAGNLYPVNSSYLSSWGVSPTVLSSGAIANFVQTSEITNSIKAAGKNFVVDSNNLINISSSALGAAYGNIGASPITVDPSVMPMFNVETGNQLVKANNSSKWELLLGGDTYYVPNVQVLGAWGFHGSPQTISAALFAEFGTGSTLGTTVEDQSNNYYFLDGTKHLIPSKYVNDWIGSVGASIQLPDNEILPQQGSTIYSPIFIVNGTPNIYTMINGQYTYVQTDNILNGLGYPAIYQLMGINQSGIAGLTQSTSAATQFLVNGGTTYYMQAGTAYPLNSTYSSLWAAGKTPLTYSGTDFSQRFNVSSITYGPSLNDSSNTKWIVDNGTLLNVNKYSDAYGITGYMNLNVINLPKQNTSGTYLARSGTTPSNNSVWLINGGTKQWLSNAAEFYGYGGNTEPTTYLSNTLLSDIPTTSGSPSLIMGTGTSGLKFVVNGQYYAFPNSITLTNYVGSNPITTVSPSIYNSISGQAGTLSQIIEDTSTHKIYYVASGQIQWIENATAYSHYSSIPITYLPDYVVNWFTQGASITN